MWDIAVVSDITCSNIQKRQRKRNHSYNNTYVIKNLIISAPCKNYHSYCGDKWPKYSCALQTYIPNYCPLLCGVCSKFRFCYTKFISYVLHYMYVHTFSHIDILNLKQFATSSVSTD